MADFFRKSVADFPKVGDRFPQSRWKIFTKSVGHFSNNRTNYVIPKFFVSNTWHCFFPKTECDLSSRSNAFAQSATFQSQLKVAKVVLLLGGNISCMFSGGSRCLGISLFRFLEVLPKVSSCMFFLVGIVNRHRQECTQARSRLNERADFGRQEQKQPSSNQQLEQQCLNTFAFVPVLENRALRKLLCFSGTRIKRDEGARRHPLSEPFVRLPKLG